LHAARDSLIFEIQYPEFVFGAVEQHSQVIAVHAKHTTDLIFALFVQEDGAKQLLVFFWQLSKHAANVLVGLPGDQQTFQIQHLIGPSQVKVLQRLAARARAVEFHQDIVADGVDEGAKTLRLPYASLLAESSDNTAERFLTKLVNGIGSQQAGAQLTPQALFKLGDKELILHWIASAQPLHIHTVESEEFY